LFNGLDGNESPEDKGYLYDDGFFVSNDGDEVIASLLRDLGYDPIMP
jgi:hypothetical protein